MSSAHSETQPLLIEKSPTDYYEPLISRECTISPEHQRAMWWQVQDISIPMIRGPFVCLIMMSQCAGVAFFRRGSRGCVLHSWNSMLLLDELVPR